MLTYLIRRLLYAIPIVVGVNLIVFALFFVVNSPDQIARTMLGGKNVTQEDIEKWKIEHNYHLPLLWYKGELTVAAAPTAVQPESVPGYDFKTISKPTVQPGTYRVELDVNGGAMNEHLIVVVAKGTHRDPLVAIGAEGAELQYGGRAALEKEANKVALGDDEDARAVFVLDGRGEDASGIRQSTPAWITFELDELSDITIQLLFASPALFDQELAAAAAEAAGGDAETIAEEVDVEAAEAARARAVESRFANVDMRLMQFEEVKEWSKHFTETILWQKGVNMFKFDFGKSDQGDVPISREIENRMGPSLSITLPIFVLSLIFTVFFAMIIALFRGTYVDFWGTVLCVVLMSVSALFYIIGGQFLLGKELKLFPISGYDPDILQNWKFVFLPIVIGIISSLGSSIRFNRTIFLEEINRDYVRTARAKGLSERVVLFKHVLKNAMIPILTSVVVQIPFLFMGSLLLESFFSVPGLGSYTIDAIAQQDFAVVRVMVYLGSLLYIVGLLLTDISYTLVDPRIRFS